MTKHLFRCSYGELTRDYLHWCYACQEWIEDMESDCPGVQIEACHVCRIIGASEVI